MIPLNDINFVRRTFATECREGVRMGVIIAIQDNIIRLGVLKDLSAVSSASSYSRCFDGEIELVFNEPSTSLTEVV